MKNWLGNLALKIEFLVKMNIRLFFSAGVLRTTLKWTEVNRSLLAKLSAEKKRLSHRGSSGSENKPQLIAREITLDRSHCVFARDLTMTEPQEEKKKQQAWSFLTKPNNQNWQHLPTIYIFSQFIVFFVFWSLCSTIRELKYLIIQIDKKSNHLSINPFL